MKRKFIFTVTFLPFLFLALAHARGFFSFFEKEKTLTEEEVNYHSGEVLGEMSGKQQNLFSKGNLFNITHFVPIRKEGFSDLVISGAHASVILDVDSGTLLHYNNGKEKRQIASLTKIMTAILVVENVSDLDEEVVIDEDSIYTEGTRIGCPRSGYCIGERLKVGEKISVRSLLEAMLMNSANDAATALGKYVGGGSIDNFVKMMNEKAKEIGLNDSYFCTPSGLEIEGQESQCYSTAYDIARIGAYSMNYKIIWDIMRFPNKTIYSTDGKYAHEIFNTDRLLGEDHDYLGGKTGFTPLAGYSLLMGASDDTKKHRIVAVVLDDPYRWQDIKTMFDWAFQSYEWK